MAINTNFERMDPEGGRMVLSRGPVDRVEVKPPATIPTTTPPRPPVQQMTPTTPIVVATPPIMPTPPLVFTPPIIPSIPFLPPQKTTTQIAQGAISLLSGANQAVVQEAVNTAKNRNVAAGSLMNYLERKVKIGEVLSELAARWSAETRQDFAEAFQMPQDKTDVMDSIVSVAILNDPDLSDELLVENMPDATEGDLLENRRIVWQYPPPGTVLQPPFLVLLAVEHRDTKRAEDVIQSIVGSLVDYQGYKLPRAAVQKLTGRTTFTAVSPALNIAALNIRPSI